MARKFGRTAGTLACLAVLAVMSAEGDHARELRITLPRYSKLTPVQRLNREGVEAARKHQVEKAQTLFYKAYLYDPADPFTLNNLGYAAELEGDAERAGKFYGLAEKQSCDAVIDLSSLNELRAKPMLYALQDIQNAPLRLNRVNVQAIQLLLQDRAFEAALLLKRGLALDPKNPFTLNNLAVAEERTGDLESAAQHYAAAADAHSGETIIVSPARSWRGKRISDLAEGSHKRVVEQLRREGPEKARAAMLALQGVAAVNANNWSEAKEAFLQAYSLDPTSAFSLNNLGYLAEKDGDLETAQFYYGRARKADNAEARVGLSTQTAATGQRLDVVAADSSQKVTSGLERYSQTRGEDKNGPELIPRGAAAAPDQPNATPNSTTSPSTPDGSATPDAPGGTSSDPQVPAQPQPQ